jgi:acetyl-CoA acetyltransferase
MSEKKELEPMLLATLCIGSGQGVVLAVERD